MKSAIIDIETDSADPQKAKLKFFGGLDCETGETTIFDFRKNEQIKDYVKRFDILIGFNIKNFDKPILESFGVNFKFKIVFDLWEALAPRGENGGFGIYNKDRLHDINPGLQFSNYKLKTILENLGLAENGTKGDIDYNIFKKDEWSQEEETEIKKYLVQDLIIENKLFDWYKKTFEPLKPYLPQKEYEKLKHLSCSSGCLAYKVLMHMTGGQEEYNDKQTAQKLKKQSVKIEGGHHIHPRFEKVRGNIICRDFVSHYPTILIMYNLLEETKKQALQKLLIERITAKQQKNKSLALALKVPLNSVYGILGNPTFKNIFNPASASECTKIGRELLKRYAKTLDVAGFLPLYGFTDSVFVGIPKGLSENDLEDVTNFFIEVEKSKAPNPVNSFNIGVDKKIKFIWFIEKKDNNYLFISQENKIEIKGGLFDINCPKVITFLFEEYISKKILNDLDVSFKQEELFNKLKEILTTNPELAGEDYSVKELCEYKIQTSLQYQISQRYGSGKHTLIPNTSGVGVGRSDKLKYCTLSEFREHNLTEENISIERMLKYLKPFYNDSGKVLDLNSSEAKPND